MNMKKILALALALTMLAALAACGPSVSVAIIGGADGPTAVTVGENADVKVLSVAASADFPPYEYFEGDKIVGAEVEVIEAIAEKLGMQVVVEDMDFDSIIPAIESGKYDIGMSGFTITEDRKMIVNFTDSYTTSCQAIIVPDGSPITTVDDLFANIGTYKIGVQLATTGDLYALADFGADNVEEYTKAPDVVLALTSGKIDCVIIDEAVAKAFVAANEGLTTLETAYVVEDYAMTLSKDNPALLEQMNGAIQQLLADGTIQAIMDKYIS